MSKPNYSVRLNPDLVNITKAMGLELSKVFEQAMENIVNSKQCPTCKQELKKCRDK